MKHVLEFPACCNHRQLKGPGRQRKWKGPRSSNQHSRVRQTETPVDPVNALQNIQMVDEWRGKKWTNEWRNIMRANASTGPLNGLMSKEMMWIIRIRPSQSPHLDPAENPGKLLELRVRQRPPPLIIRTPDEGTSFERIVISDTSSMPQSTQGVLEVCSR